MANRDSRDTDEWRAAVALLNSNFGNDPLNDDRKDVVTTYMSLRDNKLYATAELLQAIYIHKPGLAPSPMVMMIAAEEYEEAMAAQEIIHGG